MLKHWDSVNQLGRLAFWILLKLWMMDVFLFNSTHSRKQSSSVFSLLRPLALNMNCHHSAFMSSSICRPTKTYRAFVFFFFIVFLSNGGEFFSAFEQKKMMLNYFLFKNISYEIWDEDKNWEKTNFAETFFLPIFLPHVHNELATIPLSIEVWVDKMSLR